MEMVWLFTAGGGWGVRCKATTPAMKWLTHTAAELHSVHKKYIVLFHLCSHSMQKVLHT